MFKNVKIILIVGLSVTFQCNGHLGILDIVSGAHDHLHSTVQKVAGGILGGLNVNFQGHIGVEHRYPNRPPAPPLGSGGGQQTVVVVLQEDHNNNQPGMAPNNYGQGQNSNNNYPNRPGYNNNNYQGQWNGDQNTNNPYGNQNYGQNQYGNQNGNYGRPHQSSDPGQNNYQQRPNQNSGNYGSGQPNQNSQENPNSGNYNSNEGNNNSGNNNYGQQTTPRQEETRPTFGTIHEEPTQKPIMEKTTEKDEPLFVPLNPNLHNFEGDKGSNNSPKRETDIEKNTEDKDEDFPIDIRFQDQ